MASPTPNRQKSCKLCGESTIGAREAILRCSTCGSNYHAKKCLAYSDRLVALAKTYNWMCGSCKRCELCLHARNEKSLILCDDCDRGYHCFCLVPQLWEPPQGSWRCPICTGVSKENLDSGMSTRNQLRRSRHTSDPDLGTSTSKKSIKSSRSAAATPITDEPTPKLKRLRKQEPSMSPPRKIASVRSRSGTPALRSGRSTTVSPAFRKTKKESGLFGKAIKKSMRCPVSGCKSEGHLSGRFKSHAYREVCPLYHNMAAEKTKELRSKRGDLLQQHKSPRKTTVSQQQAMLRAVDEERTRIELRFRKRSITSSVDNLLPASVGGNDREPPLDQYVTKFDLELFRMAQTQLAEDMEQDSNLRNATSTRINWVRFGRYEIATWYPSQFPGEYARLEKLFLCEYCLKFMRCEYQLKRHALRCSLSHPPGNKIYEKGYLAVWEIDGKREKAYCQNLCLLAMLFLDHKTLFKDVEAFFFYILTVADEKLENTYRVVAYFSKEKTSTANCVLSCLLTFPPFLRRGYGHFLIDMSYALSKMEGKIGSPEHPLSDMGLKAYRSYWKTKIFDSLSRSDDGDTISVKDISLQTGIHQNDLISTLQYLGMVKYWRGQYWIVKTDAIQTYKKSMQKKKGDQLQAPREIDLACLNWKRAWSL